MWQGPVGPNRSGICGHSTVPPLSGPGPVAHLCPWRVACTLVGVADSRSFFSCLCHFTPHALHSDLGPVDRAQGREAGLQAMHTCTRVPRGCHSHAASEDAPSTAVQITRTAVAPQAAGSPIPAELQPQQGPQGTIHGHCQAPGSPLATAAASRAWLPAPQLTSRPLPPLRRVRNSALLAAVHCGLQLGLRPRVGFAHLAPGLARNLHISQGLGSSTVRSPEKPLLTSAISLLASLSCPGSLSGRFIAPVLEGPQLAGLFARAPQWHALDTLKGHPRRAAGIQHSSVR